MENFIIPGMIILVVSCVEATHYLLKRKVDKLEDKLRILDECYTRHCNHLHEGVIDSVYIAHDQWRK
jgi:hypothetical protein